MVVGYHRFRKPPYLVTASYILISVFPFAILAECQGAKAAKAICMRCACQE